MNVIAMLFTAGLVATPNATLVLEKVRNVDAPRTVDVISLEKGDRAVPRSCLLADGTSVTLAISRDASIEVVRNGVKRTLIVKNVQGSSRSTLACGESDRFYYMNPRLGQIYAYGADRLLRGEDPVIWSRHVDPFRSLDDVAGVLTDASVGTVLQLRQSLLLAEWFFRKDGVTGFWHQVFDPLTGAELGKIGPSDLLVKTNDKDLSWVAFQGGGNDLANYVPRAIYRLSYRSPVGEEKPASEVVDALRNQSAAPRLQPIAKLSPNPVINHMIALLTPTRAARGPRLEFCPIVPAQRARYWLGSEYDELLGATARDILLAFWAERQGEPAASSPIDMWFQSEIAKKEPMKTLLQHFDPQDDAWVAQYQVALLNLGGEEFQRLFETYGVGTGAVVRTEK